MRNIGSIKIKIYDVSELKVGKWYISYNPHNNKRLLFKYNSCYGWKVYDSGCYAYWSENYANSDKPTFDLCDGYYCVRAKMSEVREYFP